MLDDFGGCLGPGVLTIQFSLQRRALMTGECSMAARLLAEMGAKMGEISASSLA